MLLSQPQGQTRRQALFFAVLLSPLAGFLFIMGVYMGRANNDSFPIIVGAGISSAVTLAIIMGLNWRIGFYSIFFFLLFERLLGFGETGSLNATKIAIGLTGIFMLGALLNNELPGWGRKLLDPLALLGIGYFLICLMSLMFAFYPDVGYQYLVRRFNVAALLVLVMVAITNRDIFHRAILWLVIGGTVVACLTCLEAVSDKSLLEMAGKVPDVEGKLNTLPQFGGKARLIGPSGDPTFYGLAQSAPGVLALALMLYYREWWKKILLFFALAVITFNIMGSGSRGGFLSFGVGCLTVFILAPMKHKPFKMLVFGVSVMAFLVVLALSSVNVAASRIAAPQEADTVVDYRTVMWEMCWNMYKAHPWGGMGVNSWVLNYPWYRLPGSSPYVIRPLNSFLQMLQETGIQGAAIYTLLYVFAILWSGIACLGSQDRRHRFECAALFGIVIGFFLFAGTSNVLENELYFTIFGLCGASYFVYRHERVDPKPLGPDQIDVAWRWRYYEWLQRRQKRMYQSVA